MVRCVLLPRPMVKRKKALGCLGLGGAWLKGKSKYFSWGVRSQVLGVILFFFRGLYLLLVHVSEQSCCEKRGGIQCY